MRSLSGTLLAAQQEASAAPYVKVAVADRIGGVPRLAWERLYTGSEPDLYHATTMPGDGSLIRARIRTSDYHIMYQRTANPVPNSDFSTWADVGAASSVSGMALASQGSSVLLFTVAVNQRSIYLRESTDYGVTLGSPVFLHDPEAITHWLAADIAASGVVTLFFAANNALHWMKRAGGSWGAPQQWPYSVSALSGVACLYRGDWNLLVCGTESGGEARVWSCIFGDGSAQPVEAWGPLKQVTRASVNSSVTYRTPSLTYADVYRAFFVEKYTGPGAYARPFWTHSPAGMAFADNGWREAVPFDRAGDYGPALALGATYVWLSTPEGVWRALRVPAAADLTADVVAVEATEEPRGGRLIVTLRNDHAAYDDAVRPAALRLGAEVMVEWGYRGTAGPETSKGPPYWLQGWERRVHQGRALFILSASAGWSLLHGWRARRQFTWDAGTRSILGILTDLFAHAGLSLGAASSSTLLTTQTPAFTVHPGDQAAAAVARLLAMAPDVLRFTSGAAGEIIFPQDTDPSTYSYGTGHAILEGSSRPALARVNWVQVYGDGVLGQDFLWEEIAGAYDRLLQVHDLNLASQAEADERAQGEMRRAALVPPEASIASAVQCGQELYDVVAVTDGALGLAGALFRVVGLRRRFESRGPSPLYVQDLSLGDV